MVVKLELGEQATVLMLLRGGLLSPGDAEDRAAIAEALERQIGVLNSCNA